LPVLLERTGKQASHLVGRSPYMQAVYVDIGDEALAEQYFGKLVDMKITSAGPRSLKGEFVG
jgi:tRNA A37 methylthiotransferase MiaB